MDVKERKIGDYYVKEEVSPGRSKYCVYNEDGDELFCWWFKNNISDETLLDIIGLYKAAFKDGFECGEEAKAREIREVLGIRRL